jgi:hypothetical protein
VRVQLPQSIAAQQGEQVVPFGGNFHTTKVIHYFKRNFEFRTAPSVYLCVFNALDEVSFIVQLKTPIIYSNI